MKGCLIMVYIQEHHSDSDDIIKYSKFHLKFFMRKLTISCMMGFCVYKSLALYSKCLETFHINNLTIIRFFNIWSKEAIKISVIQVHSIKLMDIWIQLLFLNK